MPRARNIKPGFFTNEYLVECEPLARILFAGLWCLADREGRLEDRPRKIKASLLPYDDCDIEKLLNQLENQDFIIRYEAAGKNYIQVVNFVKHQNPHHKEVASVIPAPSADVGKDIKQAQSGLNTGFVQDCVNHDSILNQDCVNHEASTFKEIASCPTDSLILIPDSFNLIPETITTDNLKNGVGVDNFVDKDREVINWYQNNIGPVTSMIEQEKLLDWCERYPAIWIKKAIEIAVFNKAKKMSYIEAILQKWEVNGIDAERKPWEEKKQNSKAPGQPAVQLYPNPNCLECEGKGYKLLVTTIGDEKIEVKNKCTCWQPVPEWAQYYHPGGEG